MAFFPVSVGCIICLYNTVVGRFCLNVRILIYYEPYYRCFTHTHAHTINLGNRRCVFQWLHYPQCCTPPHESSPPIIWKHRSSWWRNTLGAGALYGSK